MSGILDRVRRRTRRTGVPAEGASAAGGGPPLHEIKLRAIDAAFAGGRVKSVADLGGVWAVDGGYSFYALKTHRPERAVLVDESVTAATRERARNHPQLEIVEGSFGDPAIAERVGAVDAVILFDVLLHQVAPDWDEIMAMYAARARHLIIVQPQYVAGDETIRLVDLGRERYLEIVPDVPEHHEMWDRLDEYLPDRGRKYRDIHNIWQWGITDADLRRRAEELGLEEIHYEDGGVWQDRVAFGNHAFVFRRR